MAGAALLVTGVAGALGLHVAAALLRRGEAVLGVDDPERRGGDPALRAARLAQLRSFPSFSLATLDPAPGTFLDRLAVRPRAVVHLAEPPREPAARVAAQLDLLEQCRARLPDLTGGLVQALPASPARAAGRDRLARCEEVLGRAFARLHGLPQTALRPTELYGPWGEPGGTLFRLVDAIRAGRPVPSPEGVPPRRLLWLEDAAAAVLAALDRPPAGPAPHRRLDLAGPEPVQPGRLLGLLEAALGRTALRPAGFAAAPDPGDADGAPDGASAAWDALGWRPVTEPDAGVARFVGWYRERHETPVA